MCMPRMNMTSTGKYKVNTTNLYNNRHQDDSANNYSAPRRPHRPSSSHITRLRPSVERDATDGEDEKKVLSLSERIKRLSTSRVLKDNSVLTHNNNEPFTYLRSPTSQKTSAGASAVNISAYPKSSHPSTSTTRTLPNHHHTNGVNKTGREVIYAQVVVDPEDRKNKQRNKRTVHRSYNNNNYNNPNTTQPTNTTSSNTTRTSLFNQTKPHASPRTNTAVRASQVMGKNVTTVLLNSSSDDLPSSLNMEERIGGFSHDSRYRSSSSPLLASNDDYYPKSPGIVKQHLQNGHTNNRNRSRYENHYQRHSSDYLNRQSDEDDYNDYKFRGKYEMGDNKLKRSPGFLSSSYGGGGRDTDNSDDFYSYQPINYGGKSASTNVIDGYGYNKARASYRIDEEDEYDTRTSHKFADRKSKTLERDSSFIASRNRTEDFINRSKTLDNRISSLRERSLMLKEQNRRERGDVFDPYSDLTTSYDLENSRNNAQNSKIYSSNNTTTAGKFKDKSSGSSNIFSTLLRRNNKKAEAKNTTQSKSTSNLNISSANTNINSHNKTTTKPLEKKSGQHSNFFTSFLEKKRNKKQQNLQNADLKKGQSQGVPQPNTYQVFKSYAFDYLCFSKMYHPQNLCSFPKAVSMSRT